MSIKQVELFESNNIWNLQKQINEFISEHYRTWNILDIKYQCMSSHLPRDSEDDWNLIYTGMVIYIKPDNEEDSVAEGGTGNVAQSIFKDSELRRVDIKDKDSL